MHRHCLVCVLLVMTPIYLRGRLGGRKEGWEEEERGGREEGREGEEERVNASHERRKATVNISYLFSFFFSFLFFLRFIIFDTGVIG